VLGAGPKTRRRVAVFFALPMFCASIAFLTLLAALIVLWVDLARVGQDAESELGSGAPAEQVDAASEEAAANMPLELPAALFLGRHCLRALLALWSVFLLEFVVQLLVRDPKRPFWRTRYVGLIVCACPPLRLCARNHDMGGMIWLPWLGWQHMNDALRERLERYFSIPMILFALTILPVLLIEFGMKHLVAAHPWLRILLHISTAAIWFAFAVEFIVMVSVAEKKLRYCKQHWIDIAIIILPLISFLRSLRIMRAVRLARLAKAQQLTKMSRLYRLRGLVARAVRALLLLQLINRILRIPPEKQLRKLREKLRDKEAEMASLRRVIASLEEKIAARDICRSDTEDDRTTSP